jgi:hypothetical protein
MFLDELTPLIRELTSQPVAFLGGFAAGLLQLNLSEDPVKSWLAQQGATTASTSATENNSLKKGPQTISID